MTIVTRTVLIEAPLARVFALVTDPAARARLNPDATPIETEVEGGGPLKVGSICHFRVVYGQRVLDYRMRVTEFVANRRVVSVSDTAVPFETRVELEPENGGTRLTQTERFEPSDEMLNRALPETKSGALLRLIYRLLLIEHPDGAVSLRERQEQALMDSLGARLGAWLAAIKRHLENR